MSYRGTTGDLNKLMCKLADLVTDTFKCCIRNYEIVLPYLGKWETNSKKLHKLVQANILLNKLNEELIGLRVEYLADSTYEQKGESEGDRKRRQCDVPESDRPEAKSMKLEVSFSNSTKCSIGLTSETGISIQSGNLVSNGNEETSNTQLQGKRTGRQDSNEVEDTHTFSITNNKIPVAQKSCDSANNGITNHFVNDEVITSVTDTLVGNNASDKAADAVTQSETNEACVNLQSGKSDISCQAKCEDSNKIPSKGRESRKGVQKKGGSTTSAPQNAKRPLNNNSAVGELGLYGIKKHKKKSYKCTLCNCVVSDITALYSHMNGKKHQKKLPSASFILSNMLGTPNNNFKSTETISVLSAAPQSLADTVQSDKCKSIEFISKGSIVSFSLADTVHSDNCESTESISECCAVSCSLADTVTLVEDRLQVISVKRAIRLDDIWTYFDPPFHINKKYIRFYSGKISCYLCYEELGRYILSVRKHIAGSSHLDRINILRNIEIENKSSDKQLLDIPGFLNNIIPATQFSVRDYDFYCNVCNCFCENKVVLSHMTSESHGRKLDELKKSEEDQQP